MAEAVRIRLTRSERGGLERLRRTDPDSRVRRRASILLMSDYGYPVGDICAAAGVSASTVTNTRHRWERGRYRGLSDRPRPGRPATADGEYLAELLHAVGTPPSELGYVFSVWSAGRLAERLARRLGKRLTGSYVAALLKGCGYVWGRPKHTLRGKRDERAHRIAQKRLERLKKGLCAPMPDTMSSSSTKRDSTSTRIWLGAGVAEGRS